MRTFPQSFRTLYAAAAADPGVTLLLWGLAAAPALRTTLGVDWLTALAAGSAVGTVAFAAGTVRWQLARA